MKFVKSHILLLTVIFFANNISAQLENQIIWYGSKDGLSNASIDNIDIDKYGQVFCGSHAGVTVFDGKKFTVKSKKDNLANSSSDWIQADNFGRVWFFAYSEKLTVFENNKFQPIDNYNKKDFKIVNKYEFYPYKKDAFIVDYIFPFRSIHYKKKGGKWVRDKFYQTKDNGIKLRDPKDRRKIICHITDISTDTKSRIKIYFYKTKKSYRYELPARAYSYSRLNTKNKTYFSFGNWLFDLNEYGVQHAVLGKDHITKMQEGLHNKIWIYTENSKLYNCNPKNLIPILQFTLEGKGFNKIREDINGNIWLGTYNGLGFYRKSTKVILNKNKELLSGINTMFALGDTIFLGHNNGDIGFIVPQKMEKEKVIFFNNTVPPQIIGPISNFKLYKGKLYAVNRRYGTYIIDRKKLIAKLYSEQRASQFHHSTSNGKLYAAAYLRGMVEFTYDSLKCTPIVDKDSNQIIVTCLYHLGGKKFYFGNHAGLFIYDNNKITNFNCPKILQERIIEIQKFRNYMAFASYGNGIVLASNKDTIHITTAEGLNSNFINSILQDGNKLWISTTNGINCIEFSSKIHSYKISSISGKYLLNFDIFEAHQWQNKIAFVSNSDKAGGLELYEKSDLLTQERLYPLQIQRILINGLEFEGKKIEVDYHKTNKFDFYPIIANKPDAYPNIYYRFLGENPSWIKSSGENISFTNLPSGDYILQIQYQSEHQQSNIVSIPIYIVPLWYQNKFIILPLILLVSFFFFVRIRKIYLKRQVLHQQELELASMEAQILRAQMNPHFIFNALNSIQSYILTKENDKAYFYLGKFSSLMRNLLNLSKEEWISLDEELDFLKKYLELEQMRCNHKFTFEIHFQDELDPTQIVIPGMIIQPFIENAVLHGLLPLEEHKGRLLINFHLSHEHKLTCFIEDNGIGRAASAAIQSKKRKHHVSASINLTERRINLYNNRYGKHFSLEINDLFNAENKAVGTKVELSFPYQKINR